MSKFRPKTVFILGAGASWPYGFPTGLELRRAILRNLANNTPPFKMLVDAGCNPDNIRAFHRAFRGSQQDSVDAFMTWAARQRTSFVEIGRMAIAQVLIQRELEDWLLAENDEDLLRRFHACLEATLEPVSAVARRNFELVNPAWLNIDGMAGAFERESRRPAA